MKPETAIFMERAESFLVKADGMMRLGYADEAARAAYMSGPNAARGLIFKRTETGTKSHGGTHSRSAELTRADVLDDRARKFLGAGFNLKISCDYGIGPIAAITSVQAEDAMTTARTLLVSIAAMLSTTEDEGNPT